jgi:GNAT superfamily N-acetyltransferase
VETVTRYRIAPEEHPENDELQLLFQGLTEHALPFTNEPGFQTLVVFVRDEQGRVKGGGLAKVNWNWLHVSILWLSDELRGKGYGRRVMEMLERCGRERGCEQAHLETFSFQARPFYESLGYRIFAELGDYPRGHRKYFMRKRL